MGSKYLRPMDRTQMAQNGNLSEAQTRDLELKPLPLSFLVPSSSSTSKLCKLTQLFVTVQSQPSVRRDLITSFRANNGDRDAENQRYRR